MNVIIRSPELKHESIDGSEVFCFNNDRLRITFKGEHHVSLTEKGTGMMVKVTDAPAITKLLVSRDVPFSTEHINSEKDVNCTSPQIQLTTEFVTDPDTQSLEYEVDMLIDVIRRHRNIHELICHVRNLPFFNYQQQMQLLSQPYFQPGQFTGAPHPGMTNPGFQQPQGPSHYTGMKGSNFQQQSRDPGQSPGWNRE